MTRSRFALAMVILPLIAGCGGSFSLFLSVGALVEAPGGNPKRIPGLNILQLRSSKDKERRGGGR